MACQSYSPLQQYSTSPSSPVLTDILKPPTCLVRSLPQSPGSTVFRAPCGPPAWYVPYPSLQVVSTVFRAPCGRTAWYLADRTNGRACAVCLLSVCVVCIRCALEQKLLLTDCKKSHMRNRLVPKLMILTFV